jgi:hypothetical protein
MQKLVLVCLLCTACLNRSSKPHIITEKTSDSAVTYSAIILNGNTIKNGGYSLENRRQLTKTTGFFKMGVIDSVWQKTDQLSGEYQYRQNWKNGVLVESSESPIFSRESCQCDGEFVNDKKNGFWKEKYCLTIFKLPWFLLAEGKYKDGKRIGIWKEHYEDQDIDKFMIINDRNVEYSQDTIVKMIATGGFYSTHTMSTIPHSAEWRSLKLGIPVKAKMDISKSRISLNDLESRMNDAFSNIHPNNNPK